MLRKTYVITGMGIVEGLFVNLIKSEGKWKSSEWESKKIFTTNKYLVDGEKIKISTEVLKKVPKFEMRMDLDSMIKKIESKKLLSINHSNYPMLKKLRDLRNRVHLQETKGKYDADFYNFSENEKVEMGKILYNILTIEIL
ncbi:hypothetical protein QE109_11205 [Fusibacter bizertensis]|uniref:Uncharacterized protein n=2 Tax=Fusibacter bizertensis TaxID=1488331 RepID=A0ABT6NE67_9FIRM|nr:hypothetical protein [Fusibacter bizertensis]